MRQKTAIIGGVLVSLLLLAPRSASTQQDPSVWWPDPTRMTVVSWPVISPPRTSETVEAYLYYAYPDGSPMRQFGEADGMWFTLNHSLSPGVTSEVVEVGVFEWRYLNTDRITYTRVNYPVRVMVTEVTVLKFENVTPETILWLWPDHGSKIIARVKLGKYELHTNPDFRGLYRFRLGEIFPEFPDGDATLVIMSGAENPVRARVIRPHEAKPKDFR